jgi:DnaJ-related protein SCJ1
VFNLTGTFTRYLELRGAQFLRILNKAFRRLSVKYHPDKNPSDEAKLMYNEINDANEALSDPDKRRTYDRGGEQALKQAEKQGGGGHHNPFDIFNRGGRAQEEAKGPDINLKVRVTLNDAYNGKDIEIQYSRQSICPNCRGNGAESHEDIETCPKCNGQGFTIKQRQIGRGFVQQYQEHCDHCAGEGKIIKKKCHVCHAQKVVKSFDFLVVPIEQGVKHSHVYEYDDAGDEYLNVRTSSIKIKVEVLPHNVYERDNDDLKTKVKLTLKEALQGFNKSIVHLDKHDVRLNRLGTTNPGEIQKIIGEGMPHFNFPSERGDLYVTYDIDFPKELSDEQRVLFAEMFKK